MSAASKVAKVSVALTPELSGVVQQAVDSGDYASGSEVIREALREWKHRRALKLQDHDELRRLWAEGLASGPGRYASQDEIKQVARRRLAANQAPPAPG
jgi:antitoxin ParD1/3/4